MAKNLHINHPAVAPFWKYWQRHCPQLGDADWQWFIRHATVLHKIRRKQPLFTPGQRSDFLYFVCEGLLAAVSWDRDARRRILEFAPAGYNLLAADFDTLDPLEPEIVALRSSTAIRIPVEALYTDGVQRVTVAALKRLLDKTREKQLRMHYTLLLIANNQMRYLTFRKKMNALWKATTLQEHADFLDLSHSTVRRIFRKL